MAFEGEVPGVEQVDLGVGQVLAERLRARRAEDLVIGTPDRQQRDPGVAEALLDR